MRPLGPKESVRGGGKVKYLLSGLLRCDVCDAHYVGAKVREYECSTHRGGGSSACSNAVRVTRKRCEEVLLGPYRGMLMPDRVARMAKELQAVFHDEIRQRQRQAVEAPKAAQELQARLARLRERQRKGDPDMSSEELQVIERIEVELRAAQGAHDDLGVECHLDVTAPGGRALSPADREGLAGELEAPKARVFCVSYSAGRFGSCPKRMAGLWRAGICTPPPCPGVSEQMVAGAGFEPATFGL